MANELTFPRFKAIDGNGDPLPGGKLYTYAEGTSTNKATHSDNARSVAHANPIILSSEGEALIYLTGKYKMNLTTSADAQVPGWPVDNIGGGTSEILAEGYYPDAGATDQGVTGDSNTIKYYVDTIGATNKGTIYLRHDGGGEFTDYTFSTSETITDNITLEFEPGARLSIDNAIVVTINGPIKAQFTHIISGSGTAAFGDGYQDSVYPQWWGATGDGSTDDTTAMQACVDANAQDMVLVEGIYLCNIDVDGRVNIRGSGPRCRLKAVTADPVITVSQRRDYDTLGGTDDIFPGRKLFNFQVDGNSKAGKGISFTALSVQDHIEHITFHDCTRGVEYTLSAIGSFVDYCSFKDCDYGIYVTENAGTSAINLNVFHQNRFLNIALCAIYMTATTDGAGGNVFKDNWFETIPGFAIIIKGLNVNTIPNKIEGGWWENVATSATVTLDDEGLVTTYVVWLDSVIMMGTGGNFPAKSLLNDSYVVLDYYRGSSNLASSGNQISSTGTTALVIGSARFDDSGASILLGSATGSLVVESPKSLNAKKGFIVEGLSMINNVYGYTKLDSIQTLSADGGATLAYQNDSLYGSGVIRATFAADAHRLLGTSGITLVDAKWYILTFALKSSTSSDEPDITFTIAGTGTAFSAVTIRARGDRWTQYTGVFGGDSTAVTNQLMRIGVTAGQTATFDISRLQWIQFDTQIAAEAFVHGQYYAVSPGKINSLANDATPDVISDERSSVWLTGGTTTITDFDNGFIGQEIIVIAEHSLTITDGTNIFTPTGGNLAMVATDILTLVQKADGKWYTIAYSDNT